MTANVDERRRERCDQAPPLQDEALADLRRKAEAGWDIDHTVVLALLAQLQSERAEKEKLLAAWARIAFELDEQRDRLAISEAECRRLGDAAQPVVDCWGVGRLNISAMCAFVDDLRAAIAPQHETSPKGEG